MRNLNEQHKFAREDTPRAHGEMSDDNKMGLLLLLIALLAFGGYVVFFLVGFVTDMLL